MPRAPAPGIFDGLVQLADLNVSVADPILFPDGTIRGFEAKARRHERHGRSPFSRPEIYQDRHFVEVEAIRQIADIQGAKTVGQVMGFRLWTAGFARAISAETVTVDPRLVATLVEERPFMAA
jgi:hypothetical protein